jgi:hypothetical protein
MISVKAKMVKEIKKYIFIIIIFPPGVVNLHHMIYV